MKPSIFGGWITPEALATYVVGIIAVAGALYQIRRSFRLNKQSTVFEDLSKKIRRAIRLVNSINTETKKILDLLAKEANSAAYDPTGKSQAEINQELDRRRAEILSVADTQKEHITAIYDSFSKILDRQLYLEYKYTYKYNVV